MSTPSSFRSRPSSLNSSVCISVQSPFEESRAKAKEIINDGRYVLSYIKCPVEVCEKRDVRGLYKDAKK